MTNREMRKGGVDFRGPAYEHVFRHLFDGSYTQPVIELFSNAVRAGAKELHIVTDRDYSGQNDSWDGFRPRPRPEGWLEISDDGTGLLSCGGSMPDPESLVGLFFTTQSEYDPEVMAQHKPMGMGFLSVLAHPDSQALEVTSRSASITVDVRRWWQDDRYRDEEAIISRIVWSRVDRPGFTLNIRGWDDAKLHEAIAKIAPGYADLLTVFWDGIEVSKHQGNRNARPCSLVLVDTPELHISINPHRTAYDYSSCTVNFFGQVVTVERWGQSYDAYVRLRTAPPFDFITPVRTGIIQNTRWAGFKIELDARIQAWLNDPQNRPEFTPALVALAERLDHTWLDRNHIILAREWISATMGEWSGANSDEYRLLDADSLGWLVRNERRQVGAEVVLWKDDIPEKTIFLDPTAYITTPSGTTTCDLLALLVVDDLEEAGYTVRVQTKGPGVATHTVIWRTTEIPTPTGVNYYERGTWALQAPYEDDGVPFEVHENTCILMVNLYESWNDGAVVTAGVHPEVTLSAMVEQAAEIIRRVDEYNDLLGYDERDRYESEVGITMAKLDGNRLPYGWTWASVERMLARTVTTITRTAKYESGQADFLLTFDDGSQATYRG